MPSLLARFAGNIYWLGRYMERAENMARILDINETYARDSATGPDWQVVLDLYADAELFFDSHDEANAANVVNFYVIDRANPSSITNAVRGARDNARSLRHLISTEMWTHLNMFHNRFSQLTQRDIRTSNLSRVCTDVKMACQTFEGIAEGTFMRGEAWCFYQLGKYLERADQTTRILDMGYDRVSASDGEGQNSVYWSVLVRSVAGYHAFRSLHPAGFTADDVAAFLLYDEEFPRAVGLCADRITDRLRQLETHHGHRRHDNVEGARRLLTFALETGLGRRITPKRLH